MDGFLDPNCDEIGVHLHSAPLLRPPQRFPRFPGFHHPAIQLQSEAVGQAGEVIEQAPDVGLSIAAWCGLEPV